MSCNTDRPRADQHGNYHSPYDEGFDDGYDRGAEEATEWIPVTEALPPVGKRVLIHEVSTGVIKIGYIYRYKFGIERSYIWAGGQATHWQYLPPKPETTVEPPIAWDEETQKKLQKNE